jgi:hypothetical protein
MNYNPDTDGVDHINIYSKGKTELGRLLTNFAYTPFVHPIYGNFTSMEGFWYYYLTGCKYEQFKSVHGFDAKSLGKQLRDDRKDKEGISEEDKVIILDALRWKLRHNKNIVHLLTKSKLPLTHYYAYGSKGNWKVKYLPEYDWITKEIERVRDVCKQFYGEN